MHCLQVLVEWAANWCSLCLQADFEFAHLAAKLALEQPGRLKLVRVNLDKEEVDFSSKLALALHQRTGAGRSILRHNS